ncbi:MAG: Fic family protein [Limnohabitans sp.]|nr:Fic family protein [Limnohabitans sp.]
MMEEITKAFQLKSEMDSLRPLNAEQENRIMQKFRLDWNYHSNHLEGNTLTYGETKALILFGVTAQGKPLKDTLEITGHNDAIDWVIDMVKGERPLTENFIRELHKMLLREPYEKKAISPDGLPTSRTINVGSYKTTPNHVLTATGETFYFATPEETPAKMYDLIEWYKEKKANLETNPILLAAEFHYKFIRIHPFDDGNGRTARILMNFILMQFNYPPVIIKTQDKENYFGVLRMADAGNIEAFINYIAENLNRSLEIMIAGAKGENIEEEDDLDKEIALLEQRLKFTDKKSETEINELSVSLTEIIDRFYETQSKFKKLYLSSTFKIEINDDSLEVNKNNFFDCILKRLSNGLKPLDIYLNFHFSTFLEKKLDNAEFEVALKIVCDNNLLQIILNNDLILSKEKVEKFDKNEIDSIIYRAIEFHKQFIEQKIAEQENKH